MFEDLLDRIPFSKNKMHLYKEAADSGKKNDLFKTDENGVIRNTRPIKYVIHNAQIEERDSNSLTILAYGVIHDLKEKKKYVNDLGMMIKTIPSMIDESDVTGKVWLQYDAGSAFATSNITLAELSNNEMFFGLMGQGKLLNDIPYSHWRDVIINLVTNNKPLKVPLIMYEYMVSQIWRSKKDPTKLYRLALDDEPINMSFRELVSQSGTFASATFEDPMAMMFINVTRNDDEEQYSPLEKYARL